MKEESKTDTLEAFKSDVAKDYTAGEDLRDVCNKDIRFINVEGGMWEGYLEGTHGENGGRAKMEFDTISDFVFRFVGEWVKNRSNASFESKDDATSEADTEFLNGIYRADFKDNGGQIAQDLAVLEMSQCGVGAFKISTQFEDESDPENENQEIVWEPLFNAYNSVIWDCNAKHLDKSDAKRCTVLTSYTPDAFKDEFEDAAPVSAYTPSSKASFQWSSGELIWVAERYEVVIVKTTADVYENLELGKVEAFDSKEAELIQSDLKEMGWSFVRKRKVKLRTISKTTFSGEEILEETKTIAGEYIPIIPIYGYRTYVDGKECARGLIRKLKDACRLVNSSVSRWAESSATSGDSLPVFTESQIVGKERQWANKTDKSFMTINDAEDGQGNVIPTPPIQYLQPNIVDPNSMASIDFATGFSQRLTGSAPQDHQNPDASGEAIDSLRDRENLSTQPLADNIITSIKHSGKIYRSIAAEVYRGQRSKRSAAEDGTTSLVRLNETIFDAEEGRDSVINDLSKGKYAVDVSIGSQYESQREATLASIERVIDKIGKDSQYFAPLIALWMENITGTGLKPLKKFNRNIMLELGLIDPVSDEEKQMLEQLSQRQDPQEELTLAAAKQQIAEAGNLEASSVQKLADAKKKHAEATKITQEMTGGFIERRLQELAG